MAIVFFVFTLMAFQFFKFHENKAKQNTTKATLRLALTFKVKNSLIYMTNYVKILQAYFLVDS